MDLHFSFRYLYSIWNVGLLNSYPHRGLNPETDHPTVHKSWGQNQTSQRFFDSEWAGEKENLNIVSEHSLVDNS